VVEDAAEVEGVDVGREVDVFEFAVSDEENHNIGCINRIIYRN